MSQLHTGTRQLLRGGLPTNAPNHPPAYTENLERRMEKAVKGILPNTLKMILKTYYSLPARQAPAYPKHPEITSSSQSPMPYTEPESLGDDQTKSASFGAQADGRKEDQFETLPAVQLDDVAGKHRGGEQNPLERAQILEDEDKVVVDGTSHADQVEKFFFQAKVGMDFKTSQVAGRHFARLPIERQQRGATLRSTYRGENYPIQEDFGEKSETATTAQVTVRQAANYRSAGNGEGRRRMSRPSKWILAGHEETIYFPPRRIVCLRCICFVFVFLQTLLCLSCQVQKCYKNSPLKMGVLGMRKPDG